MKQQYIYMITDKDGRTLSDVAFSRNEARMVKRTHEKATSEKLTIQRFVAEKRVR